MNNKPKQTNKKNGSTARAKRGSDTKSGIVVSTVPSARGSTIRSKQPVMSPQPAGVLRVKHMEYLADMYGTTAAPNSVGYPINPQNAATFPWLSAIAGRFEMYRFKKLKFHYVPSCSTATQGYTIIACDFETTDAIPSFKAELLAWKYAVKSTPWQECCLDVSSDSRLQTDRYCQSGASVGGTDPRLDNLGNFIINSGFNSTAASIGEIMVEYEVELKIPSYKAPPANYYAINSTPTLTESFPTSTSYAVDKLSNVVAEVVGLNTLRIKTPGKYLLSMFAEGSGLLNPPNYALSIAPSNPETQFVPLQAVWDAHGGTKGINESTFELLNGAVDLGIALPTAISLAKFGIRLATTALKG